MKTFYHYLFLSILLLYYIIVMFNYIPHMQTNLLFWSIQTNTVLFGSILFFSVLFYSIPYIQATLLYWSIKTNTILFCSVLFYSILFYSIHLGYSTALIYSNKLFYSVQFNSIHADYSSILFYCVLLSSVPLYLILFQLSYHVSSILFFLPVTPVTWVVSRWLPLTGSLLFSKD